MNDAKMTVRLPARDLAFAKAFAREHGISLTALILRYLRQLQSAPERDVPEEVRELAGLVPPTAQARDEYAVHLERKHG